MTVCSSGMRNISPGTLAFSRRFIWCCSFTLLLPGLVRGDQVKSSVSQPIVKIRRDTAEDGYVIIDGKYLPPPYSIEQRGNEFFIAGHFIPTKGLFSDGSRGGDEGRLEERPAPRPAARPGKRMLARMKNRLQEGVLLIVWGREHSVFLDAFDTASVLDVLVSESSPDDRAQLLVERTPIHWVTSKQWALIASQFSATSELRERAGGLISFFREDLDTAARLEHPNHFRWMLSSRPFSYGITVLAMMLAVVATGNLLTSRPEGQGRWPERNDSVEDRRKVVHNVMLLGALSTVDLLLTLSAQQAGTLIELNPLGAHLLANPAMLAVFKLTTFAVVCLILLSLRGYRGAQVASWWMCMVCTILTYRWVTFNSLFIS